MTPIPMSASRSQLSCTRLRIAAVGVEYPYRADNPLVIDNRDGDKRSSPPGAAAEPTPRVDPSTAKNDSDSGRVGVA